MIVKNIQRLSKCALLIIISAQFLILNGCGGDKIVKESKQPVEITQQQNRFDPDIQRANNFHRQRQFVQAAQLYAELAARTAEPEKQRYLFFSAENLLLSKQPREAKNTLISLLSYPLMPAQQFRFNVLNAEADYALDDPQRSMLSLLEIDLNNTVTPALTRRYHRIFAKTYDALDNALEYTNQLQQLDALLAPSQEKLKNQKIILKTLATLQDDESLQMNLATGSKEKGWYDLAAIVAAGGLMGHKINLWQQQYPNITVMDEIIEPYLNGSGQTFLAGDMPITHIAVLLPLSGRYAALSKAIQSGILTAAFNIEASQRPIINFYDTSNPQDAWPLYSEAINAGANWVIGPLDKTAVDLLAHAGELPVPLLALNRVDLDIQPPANFFQYGLAPEDEVAEIALKMVNDKHLNPLLLVPNNNWGTRIKETFIQQWQNLGQDVTSIQVYNSKERDFSGVVKNLLNINDSEKRHRQIERILGRKATFTPYRRQDANAIFLAAKTPRVARLIRPQIQFQHAFNLPVYSNSAVWSGRKNSIQDIDLESIKFPDAPLMIPSNADENAALNQIELVFKNTPKKQARLFLMGVDSFNLLYQLPRLLTDSQANYEGVTGILTVDEIHQVRRQQMWAKFINGQPQATGFRPILFNQQQNNAQAFLP